MKDNRVISTDLALFAELKLLRALHLAPTPAGGQKVTTATSCIQLFIASMYSLPIKWKREQQNSEWRFSDDFSCQVTLKNQTEKGSYIATILPKPNCKRSCVSTYLLKHVTLKTIKPWTCLK